MHNTILYVLFIHMHVRRTYGIVHMYACKLLFIRMRVHTVHPTMCFRMYGIVHTNPRTVLFIRMRVR